MGKGRSFFLPFIKKEKVAKDTYSFYFDRSQVAFDFLPGQYVRLVLPHPDPDDRGTSRYFTISSSPLEKEVLVMTVRIYDSSFKKALYSLQPGDTAEFFGPMGWFLLPKDEPFEKVFIAGGIGITPFHSLLHSLSNQDLPHKVTLFASFPKKEDVLFYEAFAQISKKNKKIRVVYTLTQEEVVDPAWQGERGRVSGEFFKKHLSDIHAPVYYVVGSEETVAGIKAMLLELGIDEEKIQTEDFTGY